MSLRDVLVRDAGLAREKPEGRACQRCRTRRCFAFCLHRRAMRGCRRPPVHLNQKLTSPHVMLMCSTFRRLLCLISQCLRQGRLPSSPICCRGCWIRTQPLGSSGGCVGVTTRPPHNPQNRPLHTSPLCPQALHPHASVAIAPWTCVPVLAPPRPPCAHGQYISSTLLSPPILPPRLLLPLFSPLPQELVSHPFWQAPLTPLPLPPEPALEEFIRRYGLAPAPGARPGAGDGEGAALAGSKAAAQALRESVDVTRLSRIALVNLEKVRGGGGWGSLVGCGVHG